MEVVTGAMGTLLPKLGKLLQEEYNLQVSVKQGIKDLKAELETMQAALVKVSNVPLDQLDPQVKIWAGEVRELSYAIEDSLDSSMVGIKDLELTKPSTIMGFVKKTIYNLTELKARHKIAKDIKHIESQVRKVKERYDRYKINDIVSTLATTVDPRLSTLYNKVSNLVGTDEATDELMMMLSKGVGMSKKNLKAISVVGFGGLGKTTLVKALYDKLLNKFDCGSFVPVGQKPDIKKVLRDILHDLDREKYRNITSSQMDVRQLIDELKGFIVDKRYLIIIDDIWDIPTWEVIKCALVDSNPESRIIITTRIHEVATKVGGVYNMKSLSDDNSKRLFNTRIWGDKDVISDNRSAEVSEKILRKCGGVPLSIITIASLLVGKRPEDWSKVYDSIGFGHGDSEAVKNTRKILSFSYYDLPSYLKTCLLHLSIFPEDHLINKHELIWMWIGEGFVPREQGLRLFDLGESYFNQLVNRSMIRLRDNDTGNLAIGCRVHDMVLDLIRNLSSELNFVKVVDIQQEPDTCWSDRSTSIHRLAVHKRRVEHNPVNMEMGHVRSFNVTLCSDGRLLQLLSFKVLRVLVLHNCDFSWGACNLEHLGKLVQLRYLGLVETPAVVELPMEIGHDLKFMQTLDVRGSGITELPASIAEMSKLMCLQASRSTRMMGRVGKLTSLEELQLYSVDKCPNFVTELSKLTEVRVLVIHFNEMDESVIKALVESLRSLRRIQDLMVTSDVDGYHDDGTWEDWTPPLEIHELSLIDIYLLKRPSWIDSSYLPYLWYLYFCVVEVNQHDIHILGRLPALRHLHLCVDYTWFTPTVGTNEFRKLGFLQTNLEIEFCEQGGALPMLEQLACSIGVGKHGVCGLVPGNMPLLEHVWYDIDCTGYSGEEVEVTVAALEYAAAQVHPNRPAIYIDRQYFEYSDSDEEVPATDQEFDEDDDESEEVSSSDAGQEHGNEDSDFGDEIMATDQEAVKQESGMTYPINNIKKATPCKLLVRLQCGDGIEAARGLAYPTEQGAFIYGRPVDRENTKVTVQHVEKVFATMKLRFHLNNEITLLGHAQGRDIQWPRRDIIVDEGPSVSSGADEEPKVDTNLLHELPSTREASETLKLPSTPSGQHEVVEKENGIVESPSTIEAHETSVDMPLIQQTHMPDAMLLAQNLQKKIVGKRKRSTNSNAVEGQV